jgi:hypothetical protein
MQHQQKNKTKKENFFYKIPLFKNIKKNKSKLMNKNKQNCIKILILRSKKENNKLG